MTKEQEHLAAASLTAAPAAGEDEKKLLATLRPNLKEKVDACRKLGVVGSKQSVPVLAALLGDEKLSHMARYAMEPNPDPSVDDALRAAIGRVKGRQLVGVVASIGVRRDEKAVGALSGLLHHDDPDVVRVAAGSLGRIATPDAIRAVTQRLPSAPANVRAAVADACLACAEKQAKADNKQRAKRIYALVAKADLPAHVIAAAKRGAGS